MNQKSYFIKIIASIFCFLSLLCSSFISNNSFQQQRDTASLGINKIDFVRADKGPPVSNHERQVATDEFIDLIDTPSAP